MTFMMMTLMMMTTFEMTLIIMTMTMKHLLPLHEDIQHWMTVMTFIRAMMTMRRRMRRITLMMTLMITMMKHLLGEATSSFHSMKIYGIG